MNPSAGLTMDLSERQGLIGFTVTRYSGFLLLVMDICTFIAWLIFPGVLQLLAYTLVLVPLTVTAFLYPVLHRRGLARRGAMLYLTGVYLVLFLLAILMPQFLLSCAIVMGAGILLSHMMIGSRHGKWFIVVSVAGLVAIMLYNRYVPVQWLSPIDEQIAFFINLGTAGFGIFAVGIMVRLSIVDQENAFRQWRHANQQLDAAAGEAEKGRKQLEEVIRQFDAYMAQVSQGNMLARLALEGDSGQSDAPILGLGNSLSGLTANLHGMILKIKEATQNITSAASEILAANTQQVAGATQTSASIAQTTTTVEEMKSLADHVLALSGRLAEAAQRTVEVSQSGRQSVTATIQSMLEIRARVEGIAESILALSEKTQQIGDIITMVSDLASQSNMLALNASIEASRAGEAGKGFGVVAQEMRNLAEQSRKATEQIKEIIAEIQAATNSTVMATEEGSKVVDRGVKLAESSQRSIDQLTAVIDESDQMARQMTAGGRQQLVGVEQVATTMQHINQATVQNVASSRQTENAARNLNELAQTLVDEIARYSV